MNISSNWQHTAAAKNRRIAGAAEAARNTVLAANDEAAAIVRDLQRLEQQRDDIRRIAKPSELTQRRLAEILVEIEALTVTLADARNFAGEVAAQATVAQGLAHRANKALLAAQAVVTPLGG